MYLFCEIFLILFYLLYFKFKYSIMHVQAYVCTYKYMCLSIHVYVCMCISVCVDMCLYMCVYLCVCFCLYVSPIIIANFVLPSMYKGEAYINISLLLPPFSILYLT